MHCGGAGVYCVSGALCCADVARFRYTNVGRCYFPQRSIVVVSSFGLAARFVPPHTFAFSVKAVLQAWVLRCLSVLCSRASIARSPPCGLAAPKENVRGVATSRGVQSSRFRPSGFPLISRRVSSALFRPLTARACAAGKNLRFLHLPVQSARAALVPARRPLSHAHIRL